MEATHRAAVIIPTHNRAELLPTVLDAVLAQTIAAEVFVMDDASTDQTGNLVRTKYPSVKYLREEQSRGPTFQRNKAAAATNAGILFTIDDDCILKSTRTLEQTLEAFDHPRVGAVTLPYVNVAARPTVWTSAPDRSRVWVSREFLGGMVAIRRDVFLGVGGYRAFMFIPVEEPDIAIRMLQAGYIVRLGWADPMDHLESPMRDNPRRHRQGPRNYILFSFYNVPLRYLPLHLAATSAMCMRQSLRTGHPIYALEGLGQGFAGMWRERSVRAAVSPEIYRLFRRIQRRGPFALDELEPMLPPIKPF